MTESVAEARVIEVGLGLVVRAGEGDARVLITRRRADTVYAGYWEFPGGKVEPGESPRDCAEREVREEVGLTVQATHQLAIVEHTYEHGTVRLNAWVCLEPDPGADARPLEVDDLRWCTLEEIPWDEFLPANSAIVRELAVYLAGLGGGDEAVD
ncbi:MAG: (deoxy)nucleoside triphosphate pyrophosphohydrolase [bacterium]|nr:(deoxy)nucleoside triphosphate pyrophosphohydrolase [bacterium]